MQGRDIMDKEHPASDNTLERASAIESMSIIDLKAQENIYGQTLRLAAAHQDDEIDPVVEKKLVRKIDWRIMPIMCFTYSLHYYDKAVLSQAAIFGLKTDLHLTQGLRYSNASLIFYCGFICGAYPCSLLAQKFPTAKVCSALCFAWGAVVLTTPACDSYGGFMVNRFFLGFVESGISPSFMLVTSSWYTNREQILRSSIWYSCSGGTNLISPLINYGLGHITGGSLTSWQYMYLFAGSITVLWAATLWLIFPDSPTTARGFSESERALILLRLRANNTGTENPNFSKKQAFDVIRSWQFWSIFVMGILITTASSVTTTFASIVFNDMGFTTFESLLLNLPLGAMALITILGSGYLGRTFPNSRYHIIAAACIPVVLGCCLLWQLPSSNKGGRIAGFYLVTFFGSSWTQVVSMGTCNFAGYTKKTIVAAGIWVSWCLGNIIGPLMFDSRYSPRYDQSFTGVMICFAVATVISEASRHCLARENKRRDETYGPPGNSQGLLDMTEKENTDFRYQL